MISIVYSLNHVNNGNWPEWSAIWSAIISVISKSNERVARVWLEITSMMSDQNCTTRSSIATLLHPFWNDPNKEPEPETLLCRILYANWASGVKSQSSVTSKPRFIQGHFQAVLEFFSGRRPFTTKWLLQMGSLSILGLVFGHDCSFRGRLQFWYLWPYLVSHVTRIQKEYKNRINSHSLHLSPLKPTPAGRVYWEAKSEAWICYFKFVTLNTLKIFLYFPTKTRMCVCV